MYCPKGNTRSRFACNVCKADEGCDAKKCPVPDSVCSSTDGEGNVEFSLSADKKSIRIIASVRKGQSFSVALGKTGLVNTDLIVFNAKTTAAASTATDSRATQAGAAPTPETASAITAAVKTEEGNYIRFDTTRTLAPGSGHFEIKRGETHEAGWGQYNTGNLASLTGQGKCSIKLPGDSTPTGPNDTTPSGPDVTASCPVAKRDSKTDPKRQQDCSPKFE